MHPPSNQPSNQPGDLAEVAEIHKEDDDSIAKGLGFTVAAIILLLAGTAVVETFSSGKLPSIEYIKNLGPIGDFVAGILNPIISGCTLFVAYAVWKLQKAELAETRKVMQEQTRIAEQQRSEQRFFDLLNIYKNTLDNQTYSMRIGGEANVISGKFSDKEAISKIYSDIEGELEKFSTLLYINKNYSLSELRSNIADSDKNLMRALANNSAYCRVLLLIIEIISDNINANEKYASLFVNQLTGEELCLIAVYILFGRDDESDIDFVKKSGLFSNMKKGILLTMMNKYFLENPSSQDQIHAYPQRP